MSDRSEAAAVTFNPMRRGAADQIIAELRDQILQGHLARGTRLPNERNLAEQYRVSGPTIREAVRGLSAMGLVEARHGAGTYVTAAAQTIFDTATGALVELERVELVELLDALEALYLKSTALACVRASDEELRGLSDALDLLEQSSARAMFFARLRAFHSTLADASHNGLIAPLAKFLIGLLVEVASNAGRNEPALDGASAAELNALRRELVTALLERNSARAVAATAAYHAKTREIVSAMSSAESIDTVRRASRRVRQAL